MSVDINEFSVTVGGNVVKTTSADGKGSVLRMTGTQARELIAQLSPVLVFIDTLASPDAAVSSSEPMSTHLPPPGSQEAPKNQVDETKK
jgi:hypothetical protein